MSKEISIIPSDRSIKEMYELEKHMMMTDLDWDEYYKEHKKPLKALFG